MDLATNAHQAASRAGQRILDLAVCTYGGEAGGIIQNPGWFADIFMEELAKSQAGLTYAELSTILAALRHWQHTLAKRGVPPKLQDYFLGTFALGDHEINSLCERLNCGEIVTITGGPKA